MARGRNAKLYLLKDAGVTGTHKDLDELRKERTITEKQMPKARESAKEWLSMGADEVTIFKEVKGEGYAAIQETWENKHGKPKKTYPRRG